MSIVIACPSCQAKMKAPDSAVGKNVKCPGCGTPFTVRAPASAVVPARREQPLDDLDQLDERPRRPGNKRPLDEDEDDRPRRPAKRRPEPEEDYEEVESPRRRTNGRDNRLSEKPASRRDREDDSAEELDAAPRRKWFAAEELPQAETTAEERSAALTFWVLTIIPCLSPIAPLVWWIMKKKEMPFVDHQGKQWLNFMCTFFVVGIALGIVSSVGSLVGGLIHWTIGAGVSGLFSLVMLACMVMSVVWTIMALIKAKNGVWYRIPYTFQLFKSDNATIAAGSAIDLAEDDDAPETTRRRKR